MRSDAVLLPSGKVVDPYHSIEGPDWANIVGITLQGNVLLVEQYRHPVKQVQIEFPGGIIDKGEVPLEAARREFLEETGYGNGYWFELGALNSMSARFTSQFHSFLAIDVEKLATPELDDQEDIRVVEVPWHNFVDKLPLQDAHHMASLMLLYDYYSKHMAEPALRRLQLW